MSKQLDKITSYPAIWIGLYICGSIMCLLSIGHLYGGIAAGSAFAFLTLSGIFGYESLSRRSVETTISKKVDTLDKKQAHLNREIARTRSDVDALKDDMVQTAMTLQKELKKYHALTDTPPASATRVTAPSSAMGAVKRSFEKMGNRMRPSFMPGQKPANEEFPAPQSTDIKESKIKKYTHLLNPFTPSDDLAPPAQPQPETQIPQYNDTLLSELIHHAVQNDKIEIFAQPIVKLPSRKMVYLELFARIRARAGIYLPAETYRPLAEKETTIENLDHLLLLHTIDTIRADARRDVTIGYFINISTRAFKNAMYMGNLLEFLKSRRDLAPNLIFEIQFKDYKKLTPQMIRVIDGLSQLGCRFSIDNIATLDFDDDMMAEQGFNFLKISSDKLVELCQSSTGEMDLARLKSRLDSSGLELIVEKFEEEQDLIELLDFEIDYGEGYLFGRPDLEMAYRKHVA